MPKPRTCGAAWPFLLLVIALGGCTVGPDYVMPEYDVPDAWESAAAADVEGEVPPILDWWSAFGDPVLDSLMIRARDANLDLVIAVGRVSEARAFRAIAGGDYWPQVDGTGKYTWGETPLLPGGPTETWNFGLGALWEIDLFGRVRRGAEAAGADFHAAIEDYRDVQVSLYSEVATSYVNIRALQARLIYAQSNVESQRETMEVVTAREEAGIVPRLDVARARSNLANTEAAIPSLKTGLAAEKNQLSLLLGEVPGEAGLRIGPYKAIPVPPDSLMSVMPANLLRRRPDIRAAERQLAAQTARVGVATAELYPKLSLGGTVGVLAGSFSDLGSDAVRWNLTPGFSWNLFNGGKVRGQIKVQEARVDQSLANYEKTILQALGEVESAIVAMKQTRIRQDLLTIAVEAAQESVTLVHTQYIEGLTDFQAYLDAQRVLFNQQDQLAITRGNVFESVVVLNRAMGGGWSLEEPEPDLPDPEQAAPQGNVPNPADDEQGDDDDAND
jgi:NodT family efflux transporter outer membrane factor (OMF) lipoprotein